MRFWDSSALVPLIIQEEQSSWARNQLRSDSVVVAWALSAVEVHSALRRRTNEGSLASADFVEARRRAKVLIGTMKMVVALERVTERALRVLDLHPLRAADAMQLAAALIACHERPQDLSFVTLDGRLADAAAREGFPLVTFPK